MNAQRLWMLGAAIVAAGLLALGWFVGVSPQLAMMAATDEQRRGVDAQNAATEAAVARLEKDFDDLDVLEAERDALRESIPVTHNKSLFVDQVNALAEGSSTRVTQLNTSPLMPYAPPVVEEPVTEEDADGGEETSGEVEPVEPVAPSAPAGPPIITDPLITATNFYPMEVTVGVSGTNAAVLDFVDGLQHGDRLCLVTQLQISFDEESGEYTATATGYIYVIVEEDPNATGETSE
jgi:hypothetical protein